MNKEPRFGNIYSKGVQGLVCFCPICGNAFLKPLGVWHGVNLFCTDQCAFTAFCKEVAA